MDKVTLVLPLRDGPKEELRHTLRSWENNVYAKEIKLIVSYRKYGEPATAIVRRQG